MFVYTRIRDSLQHEFLFGSIQCMFANRRTIICSYSVRTGAINRTPTPTECALRIVHAHQCLSTYTHIYATCIHCREPIYRARISRNVRCGLSSYTNIYPRAPTVIRGVIIQFGVNGRDKSVPTPTECTLRLSTHNHIYTTNM